MDHARHGRRVRALDGHLERCASPRLGLAAVALTPRRFARTAALGNSKGALAAAYAFIVHSAVLTPTLLIPIADIVKIIDSQPDLAAQLRRVRGGYLKIQGTWMPYEIALRLARRCAVLSCTLSPSRCCLLTGPPALPLVTG